MTTAAIALSTDFEGLEVGSTFSSGGRTITESDLVAFSALTGDRHPQHTDAEWAARGRFGGRVAHGMLVLSYAVGLAPLDPEQVVALRGLESVAFKRPVEIGDTIHLLGTVERKAALDAAHGLVTFGWRVVNQRRRTVARARVSALWRRRAAAAGAPSERDAARAREPGELLLL